MKTNVYLDSFNLYFGSLKNSPYKWLDIAALCRYEYPGVNIHRIRVFSARVKARPGNLQQPNRQELYFRALRTLPQLSIHLGQYQDTKVWMPLVTPFATGSAPLVPVGTLPPVPAGTPYISVKPDGTQLARVRKSEEKGSDVNLATYLLIDVFDKDCDECIVISNDSDLKDPLALAVQKFGIAVHILHPCRGRHGPSNELKSISSSSKAIQTTALAASQFAQTLTDAVGTFTKPPTW